MPRPSDIVAEGRLLGELMTAVRLELEPDEIERRRARYKLAVARRKHAVASANLGQAEAQLAAVSNG